MRKVYAVALILAMAMLAGCSVEKPAVAYTYTRGQAPPALTRVIQTGRWALYLDGGMTPIYGPVTLKSGEEFGFTHDAKGKVVGYAKGQEITLENWLASSYFWKLEKPGTTKP